MAANQTKTPPAEAAAAKKAKTVPGIRVVSRPDSFRRAGFGFTSSPKDIAVADLSEEQLALIRGEPKLVVVDIDMEIAGE
mgnify:CR=1 FL=1